MLDLCILGQLLKQILINMSKEMQLRYLPSLANFSLQSTAAVSEEGPSGKDDMSLEVGMGWQRGMCHSPHLMHRYDF